MLMNIFVGKKDSKSVNVSCEPNHIEEISDLFSSNGWFILNFNKE